MHRRTFNTYTMLLLTASGLALHHFKFITCSFPILFFQKFLINALESRGILRRGKQLAGHRDVVPSNAARKHGAESNRQASRWAGAAATYAQRSKPHGRLALSHCGLSRRTSD